MTTLTDAQMCYALGLSTPAALCSFVEAHGLPTYHAMTHAGRLWNGDTLSAALGLRVQW